MTTPPNDGGPAFPLSTTTHYDGMSLRDWFAGQVSVDGIQFSDPESAAAFLGIEQPAEGSTAELMDFGMRVVAALRYRLADAMLAARSK